jgi:hypothetical protein
MKRTLALILLASCTLAYSCKKKDEKTSTLSAKVNGATFTAENVIVTLHPGYKEIKGSRSSGSESITVIASDSSGIYSRAIYTHNGVADSSQDFSLVSTGISGSSSESAEFDFTTIDSVVVTDGKYTAYW